MIRQEKGFSLVELMITIVIFIMVIAASSQIFTALLTQFKQQSKIGETDIEGAIGLDILRRDLAHVGFGLPGEIPAGVTYTEAAAGFWTSLNDGPSTPPRAVRSVDNKGILNINDTTFVPGSSADVLAIKGANVAMSETSQRWTYITNAGPLPNTIKGWGTGGQDGFKTADVVVVMKPDANRKWNILQASGATFWTQFGNIDPATASDFQPSGSSFESFVVYGIDPSAATLRMPFNRADYYVKRPASGMPGRCAPNTGLLYKGTLKHADGLHTELPVLDCVADLQVKYCLRDASAPPVYTVVDDISGLTDAQIRQQLQDVQVYIVAQEGQRDANYDFSNNNARVRFRPRAYCGSLSVTAPASLSFDTVDLSGLVNTPTGDEYKRYHWRLYTIIQRPTSLR